MTGFAGHLFYVYFSAFRWKNFSLSAMGIQLKASARATRD